MTCREKLAIEHPGRIDRQFMGGAVGCPHNYGYLDKPDYCCMDNPENCKRCWDREIPEEEPKTFHERLVRTIQDVGQEIINNAEDYAGTSPYISRMTITIDFDPENGMGGMLTPEISVDKTYLCGTIVERLKGECNL